MLLKYLLALPAALALVSCTAEDYSPPNPQRFSEICQTALEDYIKVLENVQPEWRYILEAFAEDLVSSRPFRDYIIGKPETKLLKAIEFKNYISDGLNIPMAQSLTRFTQAHQEEAQALLSTIVIPKHPFHAEILAEYDPAWLSSKYQGSLYQFTYEAVNEIAQRKLAQLFPVSLVEDAQAQFHDFLEKYAESFYYSDLRKACMVLQKVSLELIQQHSDSQRIVANPKTYIQMIAASMTEDRHRKQDDDGQMPSKRKQDDDGQMPSKRKQDDDGQMPYKRTKG